MDSKLTGWHQLITRMNDRSELFYLPKATPNISPQPFFFVHSRPRTLAPTPPEPYSHLVLQLTKYEQNPSKCMSAPLSILQLNFLILLPKGQTSPRLDSSQTKMGLTWPRAALDHSLSLFGVFFLGASALSPFTLHDWVCKRLGDMAIAFDRKM